MYFIGNLFANFYFFFSFSSLTLCIVAIFIFVVYLFFIAFKYFCLPVSEPILSLGMYMNKRLQRVPKQRLIIQTKFQAMNCFVLFSFFLLNSFANSYSNINHGNHVYVLVVQIRHARVRISLQRHIPLDTILQRVLVYALHFVTLVLQNICTVVVTCR